MRSLAAVRGNPFKRLAGVGRCLGRAQCDVAVAAGEGVLPGLCSGRGGGRVARGGWPGVQRRRPTTTDYVTRLLGDGPVTHASHNRSSPTHDTLTISEHNVAAAPWLRQIQRGHGLLIYATCHRGHIRTRLVRGPGVRTPMPVSPSARLRPTPTSDQSVCEATVPLR
jgi:hypothetical protein